MTAILLIDHFQFNVDVSELTFKKTEDIPDAQGNHSLYVTEHDYIKFKPLSAGDIARLKSLSNGELHRVEINGYSFNGTVDFDPKDNTFDAK